MFHQYHAKKNQTKNENENPTTTHPREKKNENLPNTGGKHSRRSVENTFFSTTEGDYRCRSELPARVSHAHFAQEHIARDHARACDLCASHFHQVCRVLPPQFCRFSPLNPQPGGQSLNPSPSQFRAMREILQKTQIAPCRPPIFSSQKPLGLVACACSLGAS